MTLLHRSLGLRQGQWPWSRRLTNRGGPVDLWRCQFAGRGRADRVDVSETLGALNTRQHGW